MILAILVVALSVSPGNPSDTPSNAATSHNVQCFLAASKLIGSGDPDREQIGLMGSMFFAGQVFGGDPKINLKLAVAKENAILTPQDYPRLLQSCGKEMEERGKQISDAGTVVRESVSRR